MASTFIIISTLFCKTKYEFQKLHSTFNHPVNRSAVGPRHDAVVSDEGEILTEASEAGHPKVCTLAARRRRPASCAMPKECLGLAELFQSAC